MSDLGKEIWKDYYQSIYDSRPDNWTTKRAQRLTTEELAERQEALRVEQLQRDEAYEREFVTTYMYEQFTTPEAIEEEVQARLREKYRLMEAEAAKRAETFAEEVAQVLPEIELHFVEFGGVSTRDELTKGLPKLKRSNKTVLEWLKAFPKEAQFQCAYDEAHGLLQVTCLLPWTKVRVALDADQKTAPKRKSYYAEPKWYEHVRGTFNDTIKGVKRDEKQAV